MADIEKVIKGLEKWIDDPLAQNAEIEPQLVHDALELLKEQNFRIKNIVGELVRCKDCKHRPKEFQFTTSYRAKETYLEFPDDSKCPCWNPSDEYYSWNPDDDWFCANGER